MPSKKTHLISNILFCLYLVFLTWIIIFKLDLDVFSFIKNHSARNINLLPYAYMNKLEVFLNILVFIPFGIYGKIISDNSSGLSVISYAFSLSFFYEAAQYIFGVGYSDITDLIDNTLGAIIGVLLFKILNLTFKEHTQTLVNFFALAVVFAFLYVLHSYHLL
ncbi:VanZ family protein [Gemella sp. zg-570]|uniref:VanZ family protein n=1 Tax=Gemella sp. zg-570 TaxID=2840371 RepID=UPI001C0BEB51|nr:VanZ family protein [Gemella sp. zg-570]QWQ38818.1 VanZ family protein [Gemella sp. zg-570]